jgi:hypothetical protein
MNHLLVCRLRWYKGYLFCCVTWSHTDYDVHGGTERQKYLKYSDTAIALESDRHFLGTAPAV